MGPKWDAFRAAAVIKGEDADPPPDPERIAAAMKLDRAWARPWVGPGQAWAKPWAGPGLWTGPSLGEYCTDRAKAKNTNHVKHIGMRE